CFHSCSPHSSSQNHPGAQYCFLQRKRQSSPRRAYHISSPCPCSPPGISPVRQSYGDRVLPYPAEKIRGRSQTEEDSSSSLLSDAIPSASRRGVHQLPNLLLFQKLPHHPHSHRQTHC